MGYTADLNLYSYTGNDPANRVDPTGAIGILFQGVLKIAIPEQKIGGVTIVPSFDKSATIGIGISLPSLTLPIPGIGIPITLTDNAKTDIGGFVTVGASGHDYDKTVPANPDAGASIDAQGGLFRGSVSDLAGKDTTVGAVVEPVSGSVSENSNGQISSVVGGPGQGLSAGAQQTFTATASIVGGVTSGNSSGDIDKKSPAPLPPLQVCILGVCGKLK